MICRVCRESTGDSDPSVRTCGHCAGLVGRTVRTPSGTGQVVQLRPTGQIIVELGPGAFREFWRSDITVGEPAPALPPAAAPVPRLEPDHTAECLPLPDPDPLRKYRAILLSRAYPAGLANPQPNR